MQKKPKYQRKSLSLEIDLHFNVHFTVLQSFMNVWDTMYTILEYNSANILIGFKLKRVIFK